MTGDSLLPDYGKSFWSDLGLTDLKIEFFENCQHFPPVVTGQSLVQSGSKYYKDTSYLANK